MDNFIFHVDTKVLFGQGQVAMVGRELTKLGKKVLLCYGGGSIKASGLYEQVLALLAVEGVEVVELSGVEPNPRLSTVERGLKLAREHKADCILAVGGGSVVDASKLIAAAYYYDGNPWDIVIGKGQVDMALPIGVILTIAATGSEMDPFSVITNEETKEKLGWGSPKVRPKFAIMDPSLTFTLPKQQTAAGVADIMSHTMENYFSVDDSAFLQDSFGEAIMKTLVKYGPVAVKEPENYEARANVMWANSWAINGLLSCGKSHDWSVHGMEHELSAYFDITHGVGLAILTPPWLKYCLNEKTAPKIARFGFEVFGIETTGDMMKDANNTITRLHGFFKDELGIPMSLREVGIDRELLRTMAEAATKHKGDEINGFVPLDTEAVLEIYEMCY